LLSQSYDMKYTLLLTVFAFFLTVWQQECFAQLQYTSESLAILTEEIPEQRSRRDRDREEDQGSFADRLVFGGGIGFGFGTFSFINVNPQIGYRITDKFMAGTGLDWYYQGGNGFNVRTIGPMLWAQYIPARDFFINSEYIYAFQKLGDQTGTANQLWLGGGYLQRFGSGALRIGGQYNVFGNQGLFVDPRNGNNRFRPQISFIYGI